MMTLYSGSTDPYSHRCRIVLFEKDMDFEVIDMDLHNKPEEIASISPTGKVPVLIERDLILTESNIINEYIDERFPHPQLMPPDPVMRARARLVLFNFEHDLFTTHVNALEHGSGKSADKARHEICDSLSQLTPILTKQKYLMNDEFSMLDVAIAPLLWRLEHYGIELPRVASPVLKYRERLFSRPAFISALTPTEKALRK
jgi:RNA polymerase-associated protein